MMQHSWLCQSLLNVNAYLGKRVRMEKVEPPLAQTPHFPDLAVFVEHGTLDENLQRLAGTTSEVLKAENCSIMLIESDSDAGARLVVCACAGPMPAAAYREAPGPHQGVAGHVMATGSPLRIDDIATSPFADCARRIADPRRSLMCAPIRMHAEMLGVINVSGREENGPFKDHELKLLEVIALFIGKSIQVSQLQSMLDSRFAQMAVVQEAKKGLGNSLAAGLPNPDQVAKIMAKSFYKEMTRAGFGSRQIINAASEIIAQLSGNLQRHSRRMGQDTEE